MSWFLIISHVFESDAVVKHCVLWQISLVDVFVWAPALLCVWFVFLLTKRKSGWDLRVVWLVFVLFGLL